MTSRTNAVALPTAASAVDALLRQLCSPESAGLLDRIVWEFISGGGKRLRSELALVTAAELAGDIDAGVAWGAACELLHHASLIHDDIQDGDAQRRGQLTVWARYGIAQAINAGDLCITLGYTAIEHVDRDDALKFALTRLISRSARRVVCGQAAELALLGGDVPSWEDYSRCVEGKTSALFSLPVEGIALIAGQQADRAEALGAAFRPLGVLFQIQDDILDLYGANGRERNGSDVAQADKASALVVEHLRLHPEEASWLFGILHATRADTPAQVVDEVIARFKDGGALAAVWTRIDAIADGLRSSEALAREPAIRMLAEKFVERALAPVRHTREAL